MRPAVFVFPSATETGICAAQTATSAATLVINGTYADLPATQQGVFRAVLPGIQRTATLTSTSDNAAVTFTIAGYDLRGVATSTTLGGPTATTGAISSTVQFNMITSVSADAALTGNVAVGTGSVGSTNWWIASAGANPTDINVAVAITATCSVTVQNTFSDVQDTSVTPVTFALSGITAATSSVQSSYTAPPGAIRAVVNSSTGVGAVTFTIVQAGY